MIKITYLLKSDKNPKILEISNSDYFDPLEDENESYASNGCAKYHDPHKYLHVNEGDVSWVIVEEPYEQGTVICRHQYLQGTKVCMIHTSFPNGDEEIIHQAGIDDVYITFRTLKPAGKNWSTVTSSLIDNKGISTELARDLSWEDRLDFCNEDIGDNGVSMEDSVLVPPQFVNISLPTTQLLDSYLIKVGDIVADDEPLFNVLDPLKKSQSLFLSSHNGKITDIFVEQGSIIPANTDILRIMLMQRSVLDQYKK